MRHPSSFHYPNNIRQVIQIINLHILQIVTAFSFLSHIWSKHSPGHPDFPLTWDTKFHTRTKQIVLKLSSILLSNLSPYLEETIGDNQCVFRPNRSTTDQIFSKSGLRVNADYFIAICEPIIQKMWEPQRSTNLWASTACHRDSFTLPDIGKNGSAIGQYISYPQTSGKFMIRLKCTYFIALFSLSLRFPWN
jgi:hypothetical protein